MFWWRTTTIIVVKEGGIKILPLIIGGAVAYEVIENGATIGAAFTLILTIIAWTMGIIIGSILLGITAIIGRQANRKWHVTARIGDRIIERVKVKAIVKNGGVKPLEPTKILTRELYEYHYAQLGEMSDNPAQDRGYQAAKGP